MDIEKAMQNPAAEFPSPQAVLADQTLSHEQKITILKRWEYDARELEVAEEENMGGSTPSLLGEILLALHSLNAEISVDHSPPTKQGGE